MLDIIAYTFLSVTMIICGALNVVFGIRDKESEIAIIFLGFGQISGGLSLLLLAYCPGFAVDWSS